MQNTLTRWRHVALVALLGLSGSSLAQVYYPIETHGKEIDHASKVISLPDAAFGESTDYSSGTTIFRKTVVEVPGNNDLRVAADYVLKLDEYWGVRYSLERDLPYIEGTHSLDFGWITGKAPTDYTKNRCSDPRASYMNGGAASIQIKKPIDVMVSTDYWDGNSLYTPDAGGGIVRPLTTYESGPPNAKWTTNDGGWRFSCYSLSDGSEGFVGHRPNGDKYYFGIPEPMGEVITIRSPDFPEIDGGLDVDKYRMYVTRIEDRFGNWVNYGPNQISSSDGRLITFTPDPTLGSVGMVIQAHGKQWTISGGGSITVTNPDASIWSFTASGNISKTDSSLANSCSAEANIPLGYSGQMTVVVRTESGAAGTFVFQPKRHGFSYVVYDCKLLSFGGPSYSNQMHFIDRVTLVSRTVSGGGIATYSDAIDYGPMNACYAGAPSTRNPCTSSSPTTRTTTITRSDGTARTFTYGNRFNQNTGLLLGSTTGGLKGTSFSYVSLGVNNGGLGKRVKGYDVAAYQVFRAQKETTTLQGRAFVREVLSTCGTDGASPCFDNFFRPTKVKRSSAPAP